MKADQRKIGLKVRLEKSIREQFIHESSTTRSQLIEQKIGWLNIDGDTKIKQNIIRKEKLDRLETRALHDHESLKCVSLQVFI